MDKDIIWMGLDVHARTIALATLRGSSTTPETSEIPNDPKVIRRVLGRLKAEGDVRCCYEAGCCGFALQRQLESFGVSCVVVAPSLIPRKPGERIKTDRRDALKLARLLRAGELTSVFVPALGQEAARDLLRAREDVRRDRMAARHRLGGFLLRHGRHFTEAKGWGQKHWRWIRGQRFEETETQLAFEHYVEEVDHLDARMRRLDEQISEVAQSDEYRDAVARLSCLRGISTLSAMVILTELGDLRRFETPRHLMAYTGLVPSEHSSGETRRRGGVTKTGNGFVRRILVEAAWAYRHSRCRHDAMAGQPPEVAAIARTATHRLSRRYARLIANGKKSQVAATAVARELCAFIWAIEHAA
jgi:transposase